MKTGLATQTFASKCWGCGRDLDAGEGVMGGVASGQEAFCWRCAERVVECEEAGREPKAEVRADVTVSRDLLEPLAAPEVIEITAESHPEVWACLQPPTD